MKKEKPLVIEWQLFDEIRPLYVVVGSQPLTDSDWTQAHKMFSEGAYIQTGFPVIYLDPSLHEGGLYSYLQGEAQRRCALLLDSN